MIGLLTEGDMTYSPTLAKALKHYFHKANQRHTYKNKHNNKLQISTMMIVMTKKK